MQVKVDISLFIVLKSPCLYFCDLNAILYFMNQKSYSTIKWSSEYNFVFVLCFLP